MALTVTEFRKILKTDQEKLSKREVPDGTIACDSCGVPLQESITGNRPLADGTHRCSDCYYDEMGKEIDDHPIFMPRIRRG
jgi:hypothetical protein